MGLALSIHRAVAGRLLWFAIPEAVIVHKLRFFREGGGDRHLRDIRGMMAVGGVDIDRGLIEKAVADLRLTEEWRLVIIGLE